MKVTEYEENEVFELDLTLPRVALAPSQYKVSQVPSYQGRKQYRIEF